MGFSMIRTFLAAAFAVAVLACFSATASAQCGGCAAAPAVTPCFQRAPLFQIQRPACRPTPVRQCCPQPVQQCCPQPVQQCCPQPTPVFRSMNNRTQARPGCYLACVNAYGVDHRLYCFDYCFPPPPNPVVGGGCRATRPLLNPRFRLFNRCR